MTEKTMIEINGIKMEIDLRHAKKIEQYRIGSNVKVLKKDYGDNYKSHYGTIVGFDNFEALPTIVICYLDISYSEAKVNFLYFNEKTKDVEICAMSETDKIIDQVDCVIQLDREIAKLESQALDLKAKKEYFLKHYNMHFNENKDLLNVDV